jgi:soluble lytic murein transglycosylase-like protein
MVPSAAIFLLTLAGAPSGRTSPGKTIVARPAALTEVRLLDLAAIRRLISAQTRQRSTMSEGERAAAWADFSLVAQAVLGDSRGVSFDFNTLAAALAEGGGPRVRATAGVGLRDESAYKLLALGYSAHETADVVSGRISQQALDTARQLMAVGQTREVAANYLDNQYKRVVAFMNARNAPVPQRRGVLPASFDALIEKYANLHQVEAAIVRAIIETESAYNPRALSYKGAIGLMQLMPTTARELGVNPFEPEQNIEGGVRYFSQLLKMFGGLELALIAYNGGPGYAQRYARGQTALYGETRDYVRKVLARLGNPAQ